MQSRLMALPASKRLLSVTLPCGLPDESRVGSNPAAERSTALLSHMG